MPEPQNRRRTQRRISMPSDGITSTKVRVGSRSVVLSCEFHSSGKYLLSSNSRGHIHIRGIDLQRVTVLRGHSQPVTEVHYCKDGISVFSGSVDRTVGIWDVVRGCRKSSIIGHQSHVNTVQGSRTDRSTLCSGSSDKTIRIWDVRQRSCGAMLKSDQGITATCFSGCGNYIFAGGFSNGDITAWDIRQNDSVLILAGHTDAVTGLALSPCGNYLASCSADGTLRKWNVSSDIAEELQSFSFEQGDPAQLRRCTWSPNGEMLSLGTSGRKVIIFDAITGETLHKLGGHKGIIIDVAFHPRKRILASAGADKYLILHSI